MRRVCCAAVGIAVLAIVFAASAQAAEPKAIPQDQIDKVTAALPDKPYAKPAKPRKMLVLTVTKGFRHGSIPLAAKALELIGEKTGAFQTVTTDDVNMLKPESLAKFDAWCSDQCTGNVTDDAEIKKSIIDFTQNGGGWVGVHAATDSGGWKFPEYHEMTGGVFAGHPFRRISVKLDDPASPLTAMFGGQGFEISDEIYTFKDAYSREKLHILMSIDWEGSGEPKGGTRADNDYALSWIRQYGKGRVFYCAFGHDDQIWWNPKVLAHYLAGIQYALGDLKADATASAKLTIQPARGPVLAKPPEKKAETKTMKAPLARPAAAEAATAAAATAADGWIALFDGKDLSAWTNAAGGAPGAGWVIQDGALVRKTGGGDIWTKQRFGNFVLELDFKTEGNSGVFIRTDNPKDCVQTGIEIQVDKTGGKEKLGRNDCGAIYDCLAPSSNPIKDTEWNHCVIACKDNLIAIAINGTQIINMDLDKWTEARKNPDGSGNKFNKALKDFKREGHIGLQDHGAVVSYRNIRVKALTDTAAAPAKTQRRG